MKSVAVLVGSLREGSINRQLAKGIARLAEDKFVFRFVEIGDLPLYNDDLWRNPPEPVMRMKREIESSDAVLFVTPEYNRSFSPALKNAIDWGTRPWGQNSWAGKPAAVIGATPGSTGTATAQNALRGIVAVVDMIPMAQPELYFTYKPEFFGPDADVKDSAVRDLLRQWVERFSSWVDRLAMSA
jgi:chromate reductase